MGPKCHTDDDEVWISTVAGQLEGAFNVTSEDGAGNFEGLHSGVKIKGTCTGTHITFSRPAASPVHEYTGRFNRRRNRIRGTRSSARRSANAPLEEEWEGTKTTTLLKEKVKKMS